VKILLVRSSLSRGREQIQMKYVPKPTPIKFANGLFGVPEFLDYLIGSDDEFNSDGEGVRASHRIRKVLDESKELHYIALEDNDHARVKRAAEKPTKKYPTPMAWMCYDYLQAISEATENKPPEPPPAASEEKPAETAN
jgi:hypothetical protein